MQLVTSSLHLTPGVLKKFHWTISLRTDPKQTAQRKQQTFSYKSIALSKNPVSFWRSHTVVGATLDVKVILKGRQHHHVIYKEGNYINKICINYGCGERIALTFNIENDQYKYFNVIKMQHANVKLYSKPMPIQVSCASILVGISKYNLNLATNRTF